MHSDYAFIFWSEEMFLLVNPCQIKHATICEHVMDTTHQIIFQFETFSWDKNSVPSVIIPISMLKHCKANFN